MGFGSTIGFSKGPQNAGARRRAVPELAENPREV